MPFKIEVGKVELRFYVTLFGCLERPAKCLRQIALDARAGKILNAQVVLTLSPALLGRLAKQLERLRFVFGCANPVLEHAAKVRLRRSMPLLSRLPKPQDSQFGVDRRALADGVHHAEHVLRVRISCCRQLSEPGQGACHVILFVCRHDLFQCLGPCRRHHRESGANNQLVAEIFHQRPV